MGHISAEELNKRLIEAEKIVTPGSVYYHYKTPDHFYEIQSLCLIESLEEVGVLYKPLYGEDSKIVWLRPLSVFLEEVEKDGVKTKRFEKLNINYPKAACLVFRENKLMIVREKDQLEFFALGGTMKNGENGVSAALRELEEEVGIKYESKPVFLFNMQPFPAATDKTKFVRHSCYLVNTTEEPHAQNEIEEIAWVSKSDFESKKYNLSFALEKLVERLIFEDLIR